VREFLCLILGLFVLYVAAKLVFAAWFNTKKKFKEEDGDEEKQTKDR